MATFTPFMTLKSFNLASDLYDYTAVANNWSLLDQHDHTLGKGVQIPTAGIANGAVTNAKLATGSVTSGTLAQALAQSASVNQSGLTTKGAVSIATQETITNLNAYGLMPTPDQVSSITLPTNGLLAVWYQATLAISAGGSTTGLAAIFLNGTQVKFQTGNTSPSSAGPQAAQFGTNSAITGSSIATSAIGLSVSGDTTYTGDVATGQIIGTSDTGSVPGLNLGGPCYIFAAAGTYTVSIQYQASNTTRASVASRKLWVKALSFA